MELPIIVIKPDIYLYHTTVKNLPELLDEYENLEYLSPNEPYSTDLNNPKYFSISPNGAAYFSNADVRRLGDIMVKLRYRTITPLHLVDVTGYDWEQANQISKYVMEYNEEFDGIFRIDDEMDKFAEVYLFKPYLAVDPNYSVLPSGYITVYNGTQDIAEFRKNITTEYKGYV